MRCAIVELAAPFASRSRAVNMQITAGHTSRRSRTVPSQLMKAKGEGMRHPSLVAASMAAPAGPLTGQNGPAAAAALRMADLHATVMSMLQPAPSQAARAHSAIGSVSSTTPGSHLAKVRREKEHLPLVSPLTAHAKLRAERTVAVLAPTTPTPYLSAGRAPVRTQCRAALGPHCLYRALRGSTCNKRCFCTVRLTRLPPAKSMPSNFTCLLSMTPCALMAGSRRLASAREEATATVLAFLSSRHRRPRDTEKRSSVSKAKMQSLSTAGNAS